MRNWLIMLAVVWGCCLAHGQQPAKQPEPTAAAQAEAEKLVREVFKDDYAKRGPQERHELAVRLLEEGKSTKSDAASQYVLFREARDLATQIGDLDTAMAAITEMGKLFTVSIADMKLKAFTAMRTSIRTADDAQVAADAALQLVDEAMDADSFDAATRAADLLATFATSAKNMQLVAQAQTKRNEVKSRAAAYLEMKIAAEKLVKNPDDTAAKFAVGSYMAQYRGDWDKGLPLIAEGSDGAWAAAAKADIANPMDVADMVKVGDLWWDLSQKPNAQKQRIWVRAEFWYNLAMPSAEGLIRTKISSRMEQIAAAKSVTLYTNVSEATRKALPTQAELNKIKELAAAMQTDFNKRSEFQQLRDVLFTRLRQDATTGTEADFFARCKADVQIRKLLPANEVFGYSMLLEQFATCASACKSQEDLANRLLALERFIAAEKPVVDPSIAENWVYRAIQTYVSAHLQEFGLTASRVRLCAFLKSRGVKSGGVDRYRQMYDRTLRYP